MGLLHLFCDRNFPWTLHVPKNETQARPSLVPKSSTCAIMIIACDNGAIMVCDNAIMIIACDSHRVYA